MMVFGAIPSNPVPLLLDPRVQRVLNPTFGSVATQTPHSFLGEPQDLAPSGQVAAGEPKQRH